MKKPGSQLISRVVSTSRKELWVKVQGLYLTYNPFPLFIMKHSLKNTILLYRKTAFIRISV